MKRIMAVASLILSTVFIIPFIIGLLLMVPFLLLNLAIVDKFSKYVIFKKRV